MEDLLVDCILLGLVFWLGYTWGKRTAIMRIVHNIIRDPDNMARAIDAFRQLPEEDTTEITVRVEWIEGHCYLYNHATGEFLTQGATVDAALSRISQLNGFDYKIIDE